MDKGKQPSSDLVVRCVDCGRTFALTVGEQVYWLRKDRPLPQRCRGCREQRHPKSGANTIDPSHGRNDPGSLSDICLSCTAAGGLASDRCERCHDFSEFEVDGYSIRDLRSSCPNEKDARVLMIVADLKTGLGRDRNEA